MGILDSAKGFFEDHKDDAKNLVDEHGSKVSDAVDKATDFIDDKTDGKFADKLESVDDFARDHLGGDEPKV